MLVFFWCVLTTYTIPLASAADHSLGCACNPSACECSHESSCHKEDKAEKGSQAMIISASCRSGRNAVEANLNFEIYPPTALSASWAINNSSDIFLKQTLAPPTIFLDVPFKPPQFF